MKKMVQKIRNRVYIDKDELFYQMTVASFRNQGIKNPSVLATLGSISEPVARLNKIINHVCEEFNAIDFKRLPWYKKMSYYIVLYGILDKNERAMLFLEDFTIAIIFPSEAELAMFRLKYL